MSAGDQQPRPAVRAEVKPHVVTAAIGLWMALSPLLLNYPSANMDVLAVVLGISVAVIALLAEPSRPGADWFRGLNVAIGLAVGAAAILVADGRRGTWAMLVAAALVVATSLWGISGGERTRRRAG